MDKGSSKLRNCLLGWTWILFQLFWFLFSSNNKRKTNSAESWLSTCSVGQSQNRCEICVLNRRRLQSAVTAQKPNIPRLSGVNLQDDIAMSLWQLINKPPWWKVPKGYRLIWKRWTTSKWAGLEQHDSSIRRDRNVKARYDLVLKIFRNLN